MNRCLASLSAVPLLGFLGALVGACAPAAPEPHGARPPEPAARPTSAGPAAASPPARDAAASPHEAPAGAQSSASEPSAAPTAPPGPCPADMVDVAVACIDRYEAPNRAGEKPLLMQAVPEAEAWCRERDKRLCTEDEWLRACQGPQGWKHPYGPAYREHACNHDKRFIPPRWTKLGTWPAEEAKTEAARLDQSEPSGARPSCVTPEGVHDLTGNAAEWVVKTRAHPEACLNEEQAQHRHVVQGCYWGKCYRPPHLPVCDYVNCSHPGRFRSYEFGFRCCKDRKEER